MAYSTDAQLGFKVNQHLTDLGVETPFKQKEISKTALEYHFAEIMKEVGLDLTDDSLMETPRRLAKLFGPAEYFAGLNYDNFPKATVVDNKFQYNEMLIERNIIVNSLCEHHFLPIIGKAFVAYIPEKKVLGLSKLNRIVDFFARRPQIQERLTAQIYHTLSFILETENVAVILEAEHMCVKTRGVLDACSDTVTSQLGGAFKKPEVRAEFIALSKGLT